MVEKTTDESIIKLRLKVIIPIVGFLLVVSNMFTRYISVLSSNTNQIEYNDGASKRRIKNAIENLKLESEIKDLTDKLKDCETNN